MSTETWTPARLGDLLNRSKDLVIVKDEQTYKRVTIRLGGQGVTVRDEVPGTEIGTKKQFVIRNGQFILSKIDALNGAFGVVGPNCDRSIITGNFWTFDVVQRALSAKFFNFLTKMPTFVDFCVRASSGTTNRRYLQEAKFLNQEIRIPSLHEQERIVTRIEQLLSRIDEVNSLSHQSDVASGNLLMAFHHRLADDAPRRRLGDVAPLIRRPAEISSTSEYPQVSVRSFGRGTFHNPPLAGSEITWQKPYLVKSGDILVSNIKAWEGAIAVAGPNDDGRYGSHRYLTFVPVQSVATSAFLCFHLLSPEGLYHVGEASPGSADRNRTLSSKKMLEIPVPVPSFQDQQRFDGLLESVRMARDVRKQSKSARDALLPSILDRAFKGAL